MKPQQLMFSSTLILVVCMIVMVTALTKSHLVVWICTAIAGLGLSTAIPSSVSWMGNLMQATGTTTAVLFAGLYSGKMVTPYIVAYLFANKDPMWFMYILLIYATVLLIVIILITAIIIIKHKSIKKYASVPMQNTVPLDVQNVSRVKTLSEGSNSVILFWSSALSVTNSQT